ncbi:MAG: hypothetical protein ACLTZM_20315 [Ruminococcus sp.]
MCNAKRVAMNGVKRNTLAGVEWTAYRNLRLKKQVWYVTIKRIDGGEKMNNSQNKNLLTEGSIWKKLMGFAFPLFWETCSSSCTIQQIL